jgi:short-subunit dehydrogenase
LRVEMSQSGLTVTTICPGYIRTPMTDVNTYPMPFMLEAEEAAKRMARHIELGRRYVVLPWQMAIVARLMRLLPAWAWDALAKKAPHKPRIPVE